MQQSEIKNFAVKPELELSCKKGLLWQEYLLLIFKK